MYVFFVIYHFVCVWRAGTGACGKGKISGPPSLYSGVYGLCIIFLYLLIEPFTYIHTYLSIVFVYLHLLQRRVGDILLPFFKNFCLKICPKFVALEGNTYISSEKKLKK